MQGTGDAAFPGAACCRVNVVLLGARARERGATRGGCHYRYLTGGVARAAQSCEEGEGDDQIFFCPVCWHVLEGDGIGFDGTPANDRWYPNERFVRTFNISKEIAQLMDELGYDIFWSAEHHFQSEGYECVPNLLMWGLWLVQHTTRLKFGCAFNILPMWHPLRLAEDFALADILTNGRMIFGIGRGYHRIRRPIHDLAGTCSGGKILR